MVLESQIEGVDLFARGSGSGSAIDCLDTWRDDPAQMSVIRAAAQNFPIASFQSIGNLGYAHEHLETHVFFWRQIRSQYNHLCLYVRTHRVHALTLHACASKPDHNLPPRSQLFMPAIPRHNFPTRACSHQIQTRLQRQRLTDPTIARQSSPANPGPNRP